MIFRDLGYFHGYHLKGKEIAFISIELPHNQCHIRRMMTLAFNLFDIYLKLVFLAQSFSHFYDITKFHTLFYKYSIYYHMSLDHKMIF